MPLAQLYAAELLLALQYLHERRVCRWAAAVETAFVEGGRGRGEVLFFFSRDVFGG